MTNPMVVTGQLSDYRAVYTALSQATSPQSLTSLCQATGMEGFRIAQICAGLASLDCVDRMGGYNGTPRAYRAVRPPTDAQLESLSRISADRSVNHYAAPRMPHQRPTEEVLSLSLAREENDRQNRANAAYAKCADSIRTNFARKMSLKQLRRIYGASAVQMALGDAG